MNERRVGRPRRITSEQLRKLRAWKPLSQLAAELGISVRTATWARNYRFRQPSP
jgi:hypothetical protein